MHMLSRSLVLVAAFSTIACGQMNTTPDAGPTGKVADGMTLYVARSCNGCHGASGEGNSTGPNITGSTTAGIGAWTIGEFTKAVRQAIGKDGTMLCSSMTPYPTLTDQQVADLFAYLKAQKNDTVQRGMACP